jgi:ATP-dependent helicase/nuclease subunit B
LTPLSTISRDEAFRRIADGATLTAVNRRLARHLSSVYHAQKISEGCLTWETPDILSFPAWLEREYNEAAGSAGTGEAESLPLLLKSAQEVRVWERIIAESDQGRSLLQIRRAAETAREAWALMADWQASAGALAASFSEDTAAFTAWSARFAEICRKRQWRETAGLCRAVAELAASGRLNLPAQMLLAGFDEWTPREKIIIDALAASGSRVAVMAHPARRGNAVRAVFADADAELNAAARWAVNRLTDAPDARIGIIVPNLAAVRNNVIRIFDHWFHPALAITPAAEPSRIYNLSLGAPLTEYPMIHSALAGLGLVRGRLSIGEWSCWLRSPFWAGAEAEGSRRALLDAQIRRMGEAKIPLSRLMNIMSSAIKTHAGCPILADRLTGLCREMAEAPPRRMPSGWAAAFDRWLRILGWPGDGSLSSEAWQVHEAWRDALAGYAEMDHVTEKIDAETALADFSRYLSSVTFQPETADVPVQIMGLLEASGVEFDCLWITGMHQENWPAPANPHPFLPIRLQRELKMPHASPEHEYAFARRITQRLLKAADDIVVSHGAADGETELHPSPLICGLPEVREGIGPKRAAVPLPSDPADYDATTDQVISAEKSPEIIYEAGGAPPYWRHIRQGAIFENYIDHQGPALPESAEVRGGTGLLKAQAACPFSAFAGYRLHAQKLEFPAPGLDARARGGLVHRALDFLWEKIGDHETLLTRPDAELTEEIRAAADRAVNELGRRLPEMMTPRFAAIEKQRLAMLIGQWMVLEQQRAPFTVLAREAVMDCDIGGITLRARVDRIDRLHDGRIIIIDYKTGDVDINDWLTDRVAEPQLPLYGIMSDAGLGAVMFARIQKGRIACLGLADEPILAPGLLAPASRHHENLEVLLDWWREKLSVLAMEVRGGHAAVSPVSVQKTCRYCDLGILCRVGEGMVLESVCGGDDENGDDNV